MVIYKTVIKLGSDAGTRNWLRAETTMSDDPELDAILADIDSPPRKKVS